MTTAEEVDREQGLSRAASEALMAPFSEKEIGKLPRIICPNCSDPRKNGPCNEHQKAKCDTCGSYISTRHIHLDYVGHADVTHRLLTVDPSWTWEPAAEDESGRPLFDRNDKGEAVGLWIRLTVAGVTRLGYGSCPNGQNDAVKVLIGDALRNAALRFGVAWDLWAKGDRSDPASENATGSGGQAEGGKPRRTMQRQSAQNGNARNGQPPSDVEAARDGLAALAEAEGHDWITVRKAFKAQTGEVLAKHQGVAEIRGFTDALRSEPARVLALAEQAG